MENASCNTVRPSGSCAPGRLTRLDLDPVGSDDVAMPTREQIFVVGAGLAGLAAAYRLRRSRAPVLEARDAPGGLCDTVEERGYRFDRTGHLLHFRDRRLRRTVLSLLDEEPLRIERRSRVFSPQSPPSNTRPPPAIRRAKPGRLSTREPRAAILLRRRIRRRFAQLN